MKRKITLSIALVLSIVFVSLMSSDSTAQAQNQIKIVGDTGVITLGPNQKLRVTVLGYGSFGELPRVRFTQIKYAQNACNGGVCKLTAVSQTVSDVMPLQSGEAALFDMIDPQGQVKVFSSSRNVRVTALIIDTVTGDVISLVDCEGFTS